MRNKRKSFFIGQPTHTRT